MNHYNFSVGTVYSQSDYFVQNLGQKHALDIVIIAVGKTRDI